MSKPKNLARRRSLEHKIREGTKELERAKAKDEAILLGIGDGLVVTDERGRIVLVNKAFEELLGWRQSEVKGKLMSQAVPSWGEDGLLIPPRQRALIKALTRRRKIRSIVTKTHYYLRKDGSKIPVNITVTPVILQRKLIGAIEIFRDITHEKEIDKTKTEFVSLASHELRTPLTTIKWYAEMLLGEDAGKLKPTARNYVQEIYQANAQMIELVNALLNVSRLEIGTFVVEPKPTKVVELTRSILTELTIDIKAKRLVLKQQYDSNIPVFPADRNLLRMIFRNLLLNAVKYTPSGGRITVRVGIKGRGERFGNRLVRVISLVIAVSDSGYGIPQQQQSRVFSKLFRANNISVRETKGTGLGLYSVKSILDHLGGQIWFISQENKGTTFYVVLPLDGMKRQRGTVRLTNIR